MATMQLNKPFTQLTAAGNTADVEVSNIFNHSFQVLLAAVDTNVIVALQGTMDGTNYFELTLDTTAVAGASTITNNRVTLTVNGTYLIQARAKLRSIRLDFVSESGGAAATLDVVYFGGN